MSWLRDTEKAKKQMDAEMSLADTERRRQELLLSEQLETKRRNYFDSAEKTIEGLYRVWENLGVSQSLFDIRNTLWSDHSYFWPLVSVFRRDSYDRYAKGWEYAKGKFIPLQENAYLNLRQKGWLIYVINYNNIGFLYGRDGKTFDFFKGLREGLGDIEDQLKSPEDFKLCGYVFHGKHNWVEPPSYAESAAGGYDHTIETDFRFELGSKDLVFGVHDRPIVVFDYNVPNAKQLLQQSLDRELTSYLKRE